VIRASNFNTNPGYFESALRVGNNFARLLLWLRPRRRGHPTVLPAPKTTAGSARTSLVAQHAWHRRPVAGEWSQPRSHGSRTLPHG
jgi:hypothetical protein